jgi:hypothetical protein
MFATVIAAAVVGALGLLREGLNGARHYVGPE